jgi:hypothetical protein
MKMFVKFRRWHRLYSTRRDEFSLKHASLFVFLAVTFTSICVYFAKHPEADSEETASAHSSRTLDDEVYATRSSAEKLYATTKSSVAGNESGNELHERLSSAFDKRYDQYKTDLDALNYNLWCQLLFVATAVIVTYQKSETFRIPVIEKDVHLHWVCLAIPICLAYLWVHFGFLLNQVIDARIALWKITDALVSPPNDAFHGDEWRRAIKTFSALPATYDGGFLDGWFITFKTEYTIFNKPHWVSKVLMVLFGMFFGISNGLCLGLILHAVRRFSKSEFRMRVYGAYFWGITLLLAVCHWTFWHEGNYPNFQQPIIVGTVCVIVSLFATMPTKSYSRQRVKIARVSYLAREIHVDN